MIDAFANARDWIADIPHLGLILSLSWGGYLLLLAGWIVLQKREPAATLSWVLSLAALPFIGFFIYYLLGPQRIRRHRIKRLRSRAALQSVLPPAHDDSDSAGHARLARATTGFAPTFAASPTLLIGGAQTFDALIEAIQSARHHVHLEYYIFEPDRTGTLVRDALVARAAAGVRVRLLLDAVGSGGLSSRFLAPLRAAGAQIVWFHPFRLRWIRKPRVNLRNHRKIAVIDGRIGFTGGINITDDENERMRSDAYQDLHLRLEGEVVRWLQVAFLEDWSYAARIALREEIWPESAPGTVPTLVLPSGPDSPWESILRLHIEAIIKADRRVWLMTPYFVPAEAARYALTSAALRGLDVRVLVPQRSDSRIVSAATRSYYDELLAAGVRVFEYLPRMLHSKALLVDEDTVLIGSANFDNRSFRLNFELSLLLRDATLAAELEAVFLSDLLDAREVLSDRRRAGLPSRLADACARLLSPVL